MKYYFYVISIVLIMVSCKQKQEQKKEDKIIGQQVQTTPNGLMDETSLWYFGRISELQISPDKTKLLYIVGFYDIAENKGNKEVYVMDLKTFTKQQLTTTSGSEMNILWRPDGQKIGFLYPDADGALQMFEMNPDGSERKQITKIGGGINGFSYSPDMKHLCYIADVEKKPALKDLYPELPKANARIIDDMMYRHWDQWIESYSHIYIADYTGKQIQEGKDILKDEPWESPVRPWGGMEEIAWSPKGKTLVYTCRKLTGIEYSKSTNTDLYEYNLETGKTENLTQGMMGYDKIPVFSPDGTKLAWQSMSRNGYEADKVRLFVMDLSTKEKTELTKDFDYNATNIIWAEDGNSLFFISEFQGTEEIFSVTVQEKKPKQITNGVHDYTSICLAGNQLIGQQHSMSKPAEIYLVNTETGEDKEISYVNKEQLSKFRFGKVEKRWVQTTDNKKMLTWLIFPPDFDSTKQYPAILYCQGGPQSIVSQFWSYRWNFQMMAAHGYIVIAPNRRGLPGFGSEWCEQISGDYGGQNIRDYLSAVDDACKLPYVDKNRLGAVGASYGGYSVFHLAGMHNKRFKAFIAHAGIFNFESQYLETEELFFPDWDYGGPYWKKDDAKVKRSYAASPHLNVDKWDTPILIIHGEKDYRISFTQSMQAFNAAKIKGIPARLLLFPEENHWILKPQNAILWQHEFFAWLDKYLKN